ncbi:hypothetical protein DRN75_02455 [Nanoarchaeota archaeon]|nr:MAG: hypothetical protein DRN75_02455 [Nanoarchaeota archaeon]
MKIFRETPLADAALNKVSPKQELFNCIKEFCVGVGLARPGDKDATIYYVLYEYLKGSKNIRKDIKKDFNINVQNVLIDRDLMLIQSLNITKPLLKYVNYYFEYKVKPIVDRILEYAKEIDERWPREQHH